MGLMGNFLSTLFKPTKKQAYYSDALILKEADLAGKTCERVIHFLILPEKKSHYSLVMCDGNRYRYLNRNLTLDKATQLLKKRFALKQQAFDTRAATLGSTVMVDDTLLPADQQFQWLHMREIFNFLADNTAGHTVN